MKIDEKIKRKKKQYHIYRAAPKIYALSSGMIDKYEYMTGAETFPPEQYRIMEKPKLNYSPLPKAFERQTKTIEEQGKK